MTLGGCRGRRSDVIDNAAAIGPLDDEDPGLEVYADSAYGAGDTRAALRAAGHDPVIKPMPLRNHLPDGFTRDDFVIDHQTRAVTCPAGDTVTNTASGAACFDWRCNGCPLRSRCTTARRGKTLTITTNDHELVYARAAWRDPVVIDHYRKHRPTAVLAPWLLAPRPPSSPATRPRPS
ncbi:MAG: hypothetical protein AB7L84_17125 [Acidimicrobiia bacterium]